MYARNNNKQLWDAVVSWEISVHLFTFNSRKGIMDEMECFKMGGKIWTIKQYYTLRKENFLFINVFSSFWAIAIISMSSCGQPCFFMLDPVKCQLTVFALMDRTLFIRYIFLSCIWKVPIIQSNACNSWLNSQYFFIYVLVG